MKHYFITGMKRQKTIIGKLRHIGILSILILGLIMPASAQRSRRGAQTKKPSTVKTKEGQVAPLSQEQLEARNKELVKQILDLQYERDFYKKKIADWTEAQRLATEEEKKTPAAAAPQPVQPVIIPYPYGGLQPPVVQPEMPKFRLSLADSLLRAARATARQGNYEEASRLFAQMVKQSGCHDEHYCEYGKFLYSMGAYQQALPVFNLVVNDDSLIAIASYYKSRIYQENGANKLAEVEMLRSKILGRSYKGYEVALGYQLLSQGQIDSAEHIFTGLLKQASGLEAEIYAGLAEIAYQKNDRVVEIAALQKSLSYNPGDLRNNFDIGVALLESGEYQSGLIFLQRAGNYRQSDIDVHFYLGQAFYHLQQWDKAIAEFQQSTTDKQKENEQRLWLAKTYYIKSLMAKSAGNFYDATNYFRKAREAHPDANSWMQAALSDLAQMFENERNFNQALDAYTQRLRLNPNDGTTLLRLGELYYRIGDLTEARNIFLNAMSVKQSAAQAEAWLRQIETYNP